MQRSGQRIVIIGASSAIAQHCARLWAEQGAASFYLMARDVDKLADIAADLKVRQPDIVIETASGHFTDPQQISLQVQSILAAGLPDIVLIAHGSLPDQQQCQASLKTTSDALQINALSPALFAEAFADPMIAAGRGTLAVIGSVAGDRGRRSNYIYGAAKGLLERYVQGLQHRAAGSGAHFCLIKPGPTDTPMTAHLKQEGASLAAPEQVAVRIVSGISRGQAVIYAPAKWALIMLIIRHLPRAVFNRLNI